MCVSDTHGLYDYSNLPKGDILIHAGDLTMMGTEKQVAEEAVRLREAAKSFEYTFIVPGNHDYLFETNYYKAKAMLTGNVSLLLDSGIAVMDTKFYGMPWVPGLPRWAFSNRRIDWPQKLKDIPDDTQVLITHAPARGILDAVKAGPTKYGYNHEPLLLGSERLGKRIGELKGLKAHVFGHIHDSHGTLNIGKTIRVNAAICDEDYAAVNEPIVIEI